MAEIKDSIIEEKSGNLKTADSKKAQVDKGQASLLKGEILSGRRTVDYSVANNLRVKKRLPVVVDIIAGILMLILVCAVIVGSYLLFRYYSNDYDGVDVTYTVAFDTQDELNQYISMKNEDVFMDVTDNSVYFGRITNVEVIGNQIGQKGGRVFLTVKANVKYRKGEGYSLGDQRLAVGSSFNLRCGEKKANVTLTELTTGGK